MSNLKLPEFLLDLIYGVKDSDIAQQSITFFLMIYSSK